MFDFSTQVHFKHSDWLKYRKKLKVCAVPTVFCVCGKCRNILRSSVKEVVNQGDKASVNMSICSESLDQSETVKLQALAVELEAELCAMQQMIEWQKVEILEEQWRRCELSYC